MTGSGGERLSAGSAVRRVLSALDRGDPVALVTVVDAPDTRQLGARLLVSHAGVEGSLGDAELDEQGTELAREALSNGGGGLREVSLAGGTCRLYVEAHHPRPELVVVGAGHIAQPLCRLGAMLGFRVTVLDDREDYARDVRFPDADEVTVMDLDAPFRGIRMGPETYVVLVTRAHKYDYDCVREILGMTERPAYIGMIGSRRRVRAALGALLRDGIAPDRLEDIRAPVGLDIGAETPEEIAVAIMAEIVRERRGGSGVALTDHERVVERVLRRHEAGRGS